MAKSCAWALGELCGCGMQCGGPQGPCEDEIQWGRDYTKVQIHFLPTVCVCPMDYTKAPHARALGLAHVVVACQTLVNGGLVARGHP